MTTIHKIRKKSGKTQDELATVIGVDRTTVTKWETGQSVPRLPMLKKIAEALNCKIIDLLEEEE